MSLGFLRQNSNILLKNSGDIYVVRAIVSRFSFILQWCENYAINAVK